jgi:hypothetical protein
MAKGLFDGKMMLVLENIDFSLKKHLQKTILGKNIWCFMKFCIYSSFFVLYDLPSRISQNNRLY